MADERRQYSRIAFAAPARLLLGEQALPVEVLDLSQKGALLRLPDLALMPCVPLDQAVIRMDGCRSCAAPT
jgi:hypothetical protein